MATSGVDHNRILPDKLIKKILVGMPRKSVMRYKCVCKAWNNLISKDDINPQIFPMPFSGFLLKENGYISDYHRRDDFLHYISYQDDDLNRYYNGNNGDHRRYIYSYPFFKSFDTRASGFIFHPRELVDSSNGLLLFLKTYRHSFKYYVYNPTTTQIVAIPECPPEDVGKCNTLLVFDPCKSSNYKILQYVHVAQGSKLAPCNSHRLDVYSSETATWVTHELRADDDNST